MRMPDSCTGGRGEGGALALIAICGVLAAVALLVTAFDRAARLVPMAYTVAAQATR